MSHNHTLSFITLNKKVLLWRRTNFLALILWEYFVFGTNRFFQPKSIDNLSSPWKHILWVLNWSDLARRFIWVPQHMVMWRNKKKISNTLSYQKLVCLCARACVCVRVCFGLCRGKWQIYKYIVSCKSFCDSLISLAMAVTSSQVDMLHVTRIISTKHSMKPRQTA